MSPSVSGLVPFVHVADVGRSAAFYGLLGPEVNDRFEHGVSAGGRGTPGPREEMRVDDPDGYCLMIAQIAEDTG